MRIALRPREDERVVLRNTGAEFEPIDFEIGPAIPPERAGHWANYEMAYGAQPTPMDQQDAQLRMLVEQDMRGGAAYGYATGGEGGAGGGAAPMAPPPEPAPMGYADVADLLTGLQPIPDRSGRHGCAREVSV